MKQLLVVFSNPVAGHEDAFNDWYTNVHIRDVMRQCPGAIAVQRFVATPEQVAGQPPHYRYLAIYEGDSFEGFTEGHKVIFSPKMPVSEAFDFDDYRAAYYEPLVARKPVRGDDTDGAVIVERISKSAGGDEFARAYGDQRFPRLMQIWGVTSGRFAVSAAHQLFPLGADADKLGIYRTSNAARSVDGWSSFAKDASWKAGEAEIACYTPLIPRLTAHAVFTASAAEQAVSDKARARVGKGYQPRSF